MTIIATSWLMRSTTNQAISEEFELRPYPTICFRVTWHRLSFIGPVYILWRNVATILASFLFLIVFILADKCKDDHSLRPFALKLIARK